jgi:hypothetical protein
MSPAALEWSAEVRRAVDPANIFGIGNQVTDGRTDRRTDGRIDERAEADQSVSPSVRLSVGSGGAE